MLGGVGSIVEVDEAKFGKRKFNMGKRVEGMWIFGMLERESGKCCFIPVKSRDEVTLIEEIKKFIVPGTTIYSDCWKAYSSLKDNGYQHCTVNHSKNFKDPVSGVHTNNIEGSWNLLRRSLPRFGTTKALYASYMIEFMYRRKYFRSLERGKRFPLFLEHISEMNVIW
jgi:hypothetical protein